MIIIDAPIPSIPNDDSLLGMLFRNVECKWYIYI
ncbi:hypothetical protein BMW23_0484 [Bodo saltans virus]|uniref:Uncharacterized protein n=1 Tax=Bodo saltans virus TaxID=2024608 RepID=A0A2H4UUI7_9VIRU|nr:hypothetical protein QJ851_gp0471 [Bodo saltans virus]ATZ80534.1 hypothetical protein BMW23_0484 [Bodo saltans virus]